MKPLQIAVCLIFTATAFGQTATTPVILISIDTLRADHVSTLGYRQIRTPNIDSIGDHGTVFEQADCQIPFTGPSHASLLTSTYPFENQVEENAAALGAGTVTLASVLRAHGYKTGGFVGTAFLEKQLGFDQGFDFYDSPFSFDAFSPISGTMFLGATPGVNAGKDRRDGALVIRAAQQWISANRNEPFFAFVHLFDMHKPYSKGYDGQLGYVDNLIGVFRKFLVQQGLWDKALVILVSDHGESLGDHGESSHGYFIYESTLHVPLIIHWPAGPETHPSRMAESVGLIDVAPTVIDFLHMPMPASFRGASLLRAHGDRAVYGESIHAHDAFGWAPLRSVRVGPWKYIEAPRPELYRILDDPGEARNVYTKTSPQVMDLRNQLAKLLTRFAPKMPAVTTSSNPAARALLNSLGYLSAGPRTTQTGPAADPKERLPEFHLYEQAQLLLYQRKMKEAIATLGQLLGRDPHNVMARRDLGSAYFETGNFAEARKTFQQVLAAAPDDYLANFQIGYAEEQLGLLREAREHLETATRVAPESKQAKRELDAVVKKIH